MRAVFLDRDGVINRYPGDTKYVTSWRAFRFLPHAKKAIARLSNKGFGIFVISNQAGVGKGVFSQRTLDTITGNMLREIRRFGGKIGAVYYCTHRKQQDCTCRKPKAGMIRQAKKEHSIGLEKSFFIGDTIPDMITAHRAGCKSILVLSGKEKLSNRRNWEIEPDFIFKNLKQAADFILSRP